VTQQHARTELIGVVDELWSAVGELVLITLEDAPLPSDLAAVDDLVDHVSELQGNVATCRDLLLPDVPRVSASALAELQHELAAATYQYWNGIRAYEAVAELRRATRARGGEWTAWFGSVQESAARCEAHLWAAELACHVAWSELVENALPALPDQQTTHSEQARRTS
jgi:hypothetical protein